jgi:hypothetical protein
MFSCSQAHVKCSECSRHSPDSGNKRGGFEWSSFMRTGVLRVKRELRRDPSCASFLYQSANSGMQCQTR